MRFYQFFKRSFFSQFVKKFTYLMFVKINFQRKITEKIIRNKKFE